MLLSSDEVTSKPTEKEGNFEGTYDSITTTTTTTVTQPEPPVGRWRSIRNSAINSQKHQVQHSSAETKELRLSGRENIQPGVEFVPWGPLGPPLAVCPAPSSLANPTPPSQIEDQIATVEEDNMNSVDGKWLPRNPTRKRLVYFTVALVLLTATGVGVGVPIFSKRQTPIEQHYSLTMMEPPSLSCALWFDHKQPSVVTQCYCTKKISIVADDIAAQYYTFRTDGFLKNIVPTFNGSIDSCDPANQALVWLASGNGMPDPNANKRQRYILALLYLNWHGESWSNNNRWLTSNDECVWVGISCNANAQVNEIRLHNNLLSGNLLSEIALLTSLTSLSLIQNGLRGSLPPEIGNMSKLSSIKLDYNLLTGSIPSEIGKASSLMHIGIGNNMLKGNLPSEIGLLSLLRDLITPLNHISGKIPTEFGLLQSLDGIDLSNNTLTGQLPSEIGLWNTIIIALDYNHFNSTIPSEVGLITNLTKLDLARTGIMGTLPSDLFRLKKLKTVSLEANAISGTIPTYVGNLVGLEELWLFFNRLNGTVPSEIGRCANLVTLDLEFNNLHGHLPVQLGQGKIENLFLDGNHFTHPIPSPVCATASKNCEQERLLSCDCCICSGKQSVI